MAWLSADLSGSWAATTVVRTVDESDETSVVAKVFEMVAMTAAM